MDFEAATLLREVAGYTTHHQLRHLRLCRTGLCVIVMSGYPHAFAMACIVFISRSCPIFPTPAWDFTSSGMGDDDRKWSYASFKVPLYCRGLTSPVESVLASTFQGRKQQFQGTPGCRMSSTTMPKMIHEFVWTSPQPIIRSFGSKAYGNDIKTVKNLEV